MQSGPVNLKDKVFVELFPSIVQVGKIILSRTHADRVHYEMLSEMKPSWHMSRRIAL